MRNRVEPMDIKTEIGDGTLAIASDTLHRLLSAVARFSSRDETRPHLSGVLCEFAKRACRIVATDGHALIVVSVGEPYSIAAGVTSSFMLLAADVSNALSLLSRHKIARSRTIAMLSRESISVGCFSARFEKNSESFPAYQKIADPEKWKPNLVCDGFGIGSSQLKRLAVFDANRPLRLSHEEGAPGGPYTFQGAIDGHDAFVCLMGMRA